jgi:MSHA pilin protein MshD
MNAECGVQRRDLGVLSPNSELLTQLGFTLIELIIFLVLAGIILPLVFIPFLTGLKSYSTPEIVSTATFLGEELMEEIKSKSFDDPDDTPVFGPEPGEGRSSYDDVDDYNGLTEVPSGSEFASFSRSVTVFYVNPLGDLDTAAGSPTGLKRVLVTVTHPEIPNVALITLVSQ